MYVFPVLAKVGYSNQIKTQSAKTSESNERNWRPISIFVEEPKLDVPDASEFYHTFQEEMTPILHHFSSQKVETESLLAHWIGQHFPNTKTKPRYFKKIITQNIINSNPAMLKRNYIQ